MESPHNTATNHVSIIAKMHGFPEGEVLHARQNPKHLVKYGDAGRVLNFYVLLQTPFGEEYRFLMEASVGSAVAQELEHLTFNDWVAIEGVLMLVSGRERHYVINDEMLGRRIPHLVTHVTSLQKIAPQPESYARVSLTGVVLEPCAILKHRRLSSVFGRTVMRTTVGPHHLNYDVSCLVSVHHNEAGYLYNATNRLEIQGDLVGMSVEQHGTQVEQAIARLNAEWEEERANLQHCQTSHDKAFVRYRKKLRWLMWREQVFVLAREIKPLDGAESISLNESRKLRKEFANRVRQNGRPGALAMTHQDQSY